MCRDTAPKGGCLRTHKGTGCGDWVEAKEGRKKEKADQVVVVAWAAGRQRVPRSPMESSLEVEISPQTFEFE